MLRFTVQFPLDDPDGAEEAVDSGRLADFARTAEAAGFDAIAFTEHPAPSRTWLYGSYGHASLDPFAAMGYSAAVTTTLRLMSYLAVLPYRHPYVTAKAATTVDRLSGGRVILGVGSGYLEDEFDALGIDYGQRTTLMRAALAALEGAWSNGESAGVTLRPRPQQTPRPPIWIGGNSRRSRQHVARYGDGWSPLLVGDDLAGDLGTQGLGSVGRLRTSVQELHELLAEAGREPGAVDIQLKGSFSRVALNLHVEHHIEQLAALTDTGVTWVVVHPMADAREGLLDVLRRYGAEVIDVVKRVPEGSIG